MKKKIALALVLFLSFLLVPAAAAGGGLGTVAQGCARAGGREEKGAHDGAAKITNQFTNN